MSADRPVSTISALHWIPFPWPCLGVEGGGGGGPWRRVSHADPPPTPTPPLTPSLSLSLPPRKPASFFVLFYRLGTVWVMLYTLIHSFVLSLLLSLFFFFFFLSFFFFFFSNHWTPKQHNRSGHKPECVYAFVLYCIIVLYYYYLAFLHAIVSCLSQIPGKATLYEVSLACP